MTPRFQKFTLFAHITFSVRWFGSVIPYLALAIVSLTSSDHQTVQAACLSMNLIGWFVIVPFSLAALLSGLVQSLGTRWGLFRHWWILVKFALTIFAVVILFQHMREVSRLSLMAKNGILSGTELRPELIHSAGGLLVLLAAIILSVLKPWGMTPYGRRQASQEDFVPRPTDTVAVARGLVIHGRPISWARIAGFHIAGLFVLLVILHVAGFHGLHHH